MAYKFDAASTHRLNSAAGTSPNAPSTGTIAIWVKPNWNSADSATAYAFYDLGSTQAVLKFLRFERFTDHNVYIGFYPGVDMRVVAADTGIFVSGTWALHILTWDTATGSEYFVNNVSKGTAASFTLPDWSADGSREQIFGNNINPTYLNPANSHLAEFGWWNRILTASERALLALGYTALHIPNGLIDYHPLVRGTAGRFAASLALTDNSAGPSDHPPLIFRPRPHVLRWAAAGLSTAQMLPIFSQQRNWEMTLGKRYV